MKARPLAIAICSSFIGFTAVFAQGPVSDASLTSNPTYKKSCAKCHGKTAEGHTFGGPSLIFKKSAAVSSTEDLRNIIANGKGHMPKFAGKLTAEQIDELVRQVQSLNGK